MGRAGGVYGSVRMADWGDPLLDGVIRLVDGHMPRRGEVVLAPDLAETLGMEVGDRLRVDASEDSVRVVGIATIGGPGSLTAAMAPGELVSPGATADAPRGRCDGVRGVAHRSGRAECRDVPVDR
ncbi:MAG: hypothetical protein M5U19_19560 [Microthrixaceae bacterium]|nr:hypothetical protein [Microthrixaceae bacterium]